MKTLTQHHASMTTVWYHALAWFHPISQLSTFVTEETTTTVKSAPMEVTSCTLHECHAPRVHGSQLDSTLYIAVHYTAHTNWDNYIIVAHMQNVVLCSVPVTMATQLGKQISCHTCYL